MGEEKNCRGGAPGESQTVEGRTRGPEAPWGEKGFVAMVGFTM